MFEYIWKAVLETTKIIFSKESIQSPLFWVVFGVIVGIIELFFVYRQIRQTKNATASNLLFAFEKRFESTYLRKIRTSVAKKLQENNYQVTNDIYDMVGVVLGIFEFMGLLLRKETLAIDEVDCMFGEYILGYWTCFGEYIEKEREKEVLLLENFRWLSQKLNKRWIIEGVKPRANSIEFCNTEATLEK